MVKMPEPFLELMRTGWADPNEQEFAPIEAAAQHANRRTRLSAHFPGETLVVPTGQLKTRSNDTDFDFRPGTDFAYLTGFYEPGAVLVLTPADQSHHATLYLRPRSDRNSDDFFRHYHSELWVGRRHTLGGYGRLLGLECADLSGLDEVLTALDPATTRLRKGIDPHVDELLGRRSDDEVTKRNKEFSSVLDELRIVKDEWEISQLTEAVDATIRGFEDVVRALPADRPSSERLIDGVFGLRARHDGNWVGYGTIAAAGAHACTLHWIRNDGQARPGELLLLDAGVENRHFYTADITRTMPISGRFTPIQREVYDIVYAAQQAGFAAIRPGATWDEVHQACMAVLAEGLATLGVLSIPPEQALADGNQTYRRWTLHTFGHMLGIDVHDCSHARHEHYRDGTLQVGEVLTVEPGLYFQPDDLLVPEELRGIGVRIEDDVVVTENGCHVLSSALPSQADELESWMAELRSASARISTGEIFNT